MKTIQIDRQVLQTLYGGCEESIKEVFTEFIRGYSELKENLVSGYESANAKKQKKVLHFHGPSFMYLGMPEITSQFKKIEMYCAEPSACSLPSSEFTELMEMVNESKLLVENEINYIRKAV